MHKTDFFEHANTKSNSISIDADYYHREVTATRLVQFLIGPEGPYQSSFIFNKQKLADASGALSTLI